MPLRIVHLSDLHYPSIDPTMWAAVREATVQQRPNLIIVSGDLVDNPIAHDLRVVYDELTKLAQRAGASLHIVAGNHDLFESGLNTITRRSPVFDQVIRGIAAEPARVGAPQPRGALQRFWNSVRPYRAPPPPPLNPIAAAAPATRSVVCQPQGLPVLLALIDSNPNDGTLAFAAGEVPPSDLVALETALTKVTTPHLLRIAVIHHHVLPIAFSNGKLIGNEQLMVLRNAADVLALLARHRFDLVLHGHKHLAQFVRLDFSPADAEGYPIAVAAAGAAALTQQRNKTDSCGFNFIEVADNGRITVTGFTYGYGRAPVIDNVHGTPGIDYRTYEEPFPTVARRAFWRAREVHKTWADSRICAFEVTENGDLLVDNWLHGLRHVGPVPDMVARRHVVGIPEHGRLATGPLLDAPSRGRRVQLTAGTITGRRRQFLVEIPRDSITSRDGGSYHLRHEVANSMTMTDWEDAERRRVSPPQDGRPERQEWVSVLVNYPIETLEIRLRLPSGFVEVQPAVRSERMVSLTNPEIDPECDSVIVQDDARPAPDDALNRHVAQGLTWLAQTRQWQLRVRRPMVGYRYEVYWPLPVTPVSSSIREGARGWRDTLLSMERQMRVGHHSSHAAVARQVFDELAGNLYTMLSGDIPDERYVAALFIYDTALLALRPVLSRKSWADTMIHHDFHIPLGDGLAGAAFQQCRPLAWADAPEQSRLVQPARYPYEDTGPERAVLAIPVYYDHTLLPPTPWNAIGVVAYSSWGALSKIPTMAGTTADPFVATVSGVAQMQFKRLRESILRGEVLA